MALSRPETQGDNGESLTESEEKAISVASSSRTVLGLLQQTSQPILIPGTPILPPQPILGHGEQSVSANAQAYLDKVLKASTYTYPAESKSTDSFATTRELAKTSSHNFSTVHTERTTYYYKKIPITPGYPNREAIPEMEAVCAAFYQFLSPGYVPRTYSVYDKQSGIFEGVLSEEMPNFIPVGKDPLMEDDLQTSFIESKHLSLPVLEEYEKTLIELEAVDEELERYAKVLDINESKFSKQLKEFKEQKDKLISPEELIAISDEFAKNSQKKKEVLEKRYNSVQAIKNFYLEIEAECKITEKEFTNFRIIKGTAIGMVSSWIFLEDDCHTFNIDKYGKRIDFDMSLWPLFHTFCDKHLADKYVLRVPKNNIANVTEADIAHFPNMTRDATPFYWPTVATGVYSEFKDRVMQLVWSSSGNEYPSNVKEVYKKLETNKIFRHYVHSTLLKFLLTNADMYKKVSLLHMRRDRVLEKQSLIDIIANQQKTRIQTFENVLILMDAFVNFSKVHGTTVKNNMVFEIDARNSFYKTKIQELDISLETLDKEIKCLTKQIIELHNQNDAHAALTSTMLRSASQASTPSSSSLSHSPPEITQVKLKQTEHHKNVLGPLQKVQDELAQKCNERNVQIAAHATYEKQIIQTSDIQEAFDNLQMKISKGEALRSSKAVDVKRGVTTSASGESARVKAVIIHNITEKYINTYGLNSSNKQAARDLVSLIKPLNASPVDVEANQSDILKMRSLLESANQKLLPGGYKTVILDLLKDDSLWKSIAAENKSALRR